MGFFSLVGAALSVVGGIAATVGSTLLKVVTNPATWKVIANVVSVVGEVLNIFPNNSSVEKHGEQVLAAGEEGITPESFDSFEEYSDAIKNFEVNPVLKDKWSKEEKIAASAGIVAKGLTELKGFSMDSVMSLMMLVALKSDFFTPERVISLIEKNTDFKMLHDYVDNQLDRFDRKDVENLLLKNEQSLTPDVSPEAFTEKVRQLRDSE